MVEIETVYLGDLRTVSRHGPSGTELFTDPPKDNHGRGESFSPTDLVATALGSCMLSIMAIVAQKQNWDLTGARVRVEKHMVQEPVRRIGKLVVEFTLPESLGSSARTQLEEAARSCPVCHSLHPDVLRQVEFRYAVVSPTAVEG
jgi:putative redox protein